MAERIRSIKPSIRRDQMLGRCSDSARILYITMITMADDHGNFEAAHEVLHSEAFKFGPPRPIATLCQELAAAKLVLFYEFDGQQYAHLNGWQKHQRIDNAADKEVPLPPGWVMVVETKQEGGRTRTKFRAEAPRELAPRGAAPSLTVAAPGLAAKDCGGAAPLSLRKGVEGKGEEGTAGGGAAPPEDQAPLPDLTDEQVEICDVLEDHRDLFAAPAVTDTQIAEAAIRISKRIAMEDRPPLAADVTVRAIEAVREKSHERPHATPGQRLAEVERKVGFILGDTRPARAVSATVRVAKVYG